MDYSDASDDDYSYLETRPLAKGDELQETADYTVTETFMADIRQNEDHTFCGVVFDVECKEKSPPLKYLVIQAVRVRGELGPLSVYISRGGYGERVLTAAEWTKVYSGKHDPSPDVLIPLEFKEPVVLGRGEKCGIYVHSTLPGDGAIVYDDQRGHVTHEDKYLKVFPGMAHLHPTPFLDLSPWGTGGWRRNRQLAGSVVYGVRYLLWTPGSHHEFPPSFRRLCALVLWSLDRIDLPEDLTMTILNMCRYDWPEDPVLLAAKPIGNNLLLSSVYPGDKTTFPQKEAVVNVTLERIRRKNGVEKRARAEDISFEIGEPSDAIDSKYHHAIRHMSAGEQAYIFDEPREPKKRRKELGKPAVASPGLSSWTERLFVTLHTVNNPRSPGDLTLEQRLEEAGKRKTSGDAFLRSKSFAFAKLRYDRGLEYLLSIVHLFHDQESVCDLLVQLLVGSAHASCELKDYAAALPNAERVLLYEPDNVEALLINAKCRIARQQLRHAQTAVRYVLQIDRANEEALKLLEEIQSIHSAASYTSFEDDESDSTTSTEDEPSTDDEPSAGKAEAGHADIADVDSMSEASTDHMAAAVSPESATSSSSAAPSHETPATESCTPAREPTDTPQSKEDAPPEACNTDKGGKGEKEKPRHRGRGGGKGGKSRKKGQKGGTSFTPSRGGRGTKSGRTIVRE